MESVLLVVHVIVSLVIIGLILIQQGRGAEMGASFGAGSSQTVFGSVGSGNFFSRLTAILAAVFFVSSFTLAVIAKKGVEIEDTIIPTVEKTLEVPAGDVPSAPATDQGVPVQNATETNGAATQEPTGDVPATAPGDSSTQNKTTEPSPSSGN
jgi:preprotein translocase subunit SecG